MSREGNLGSVLIPVSPEDEERQNNNAAPHAVWANRALYLPDFLADALILQTYTANGIFDLFQLLSRSEYHCAPSKFAQNTWISLLIVGFSVSSMNIAKVINYFYPHANAVNHLLMLPSTTVLFFFMQLFADITDYNAMTLPAFIAISAVSIPLIALLYIKFEAPDIRRKNDFLIYNKTCLNRFNPPKYIDLHSGATATSMDRALNTFRAMHYCLKAMVAFFWALNRELSATGETMPMQTWQYGAMTVFLGMAASVGYEFTDHPKAAQVFVAMMKMMIAGSYIYEGLGGLFFLAFIYRCPNYQFCASEDTQAALSWVSFFLITLPLTLYVGANTRFDFHACDATNQKIITTIRAVPDKYENSKRWVTDKLSAASTVAVENCSAASNKMKTALWGCFYFVKHKVENCYNDPEKENILNNS